MIADGLTKDKMDPADLLRSCVRAASYQISPENHVLAQQATERARRAKNRELDSKEGLQTSGGNRLLQGEVSDFSDPKTKGSLQISCLALTWVYVSDLPWPSPF